LAKYQKDFEKKNEFRKQEMNGNEKGKKVNRLNDALKRFGWRTRIENLVSSTKKKKKLLKNKLFKFLFFHIFGHTRNHFL